MPQTGLESFDRTLQDTHIWLNELMEELGIEDRRRTYRVLKGVLHGLRDRLTVEEAVAFGAQLPMLVRGFYFEGWQPSRVPVLARSREQFLELLREHLRDVVQDDPGFDVEKAAIGVFRVIGRHVTSGEVDDVLDQLPSQVRAMWAE